VGFFDSQADAYMDSQADAYIDLSLHVRVLPSDLKPAPETGRIF